MASLRHHVYQVGLENKYLTMEYDIFKFLRRAVITSVSLMN